MEPSLSSARARGRPRGFSDTSALEGAMRTFWAAGYDGASVDTLCRATQMSRASLYQSYGDKEGLFLAALAYYVETRMAPVANALGPHLSLREDLETFFEQVVRLGTSDPETPGCLISCVLADVAGSNAAFQKELEQRFAALEGLIADRFRAAGWSQNALVPVTDAAALTASIARGITLRARSRQTRVQLAAVGAAAVEAIIALTR